MDNAYALPIDAVLANFNVQERSGLTDSQVEELRKKHGRNGAQTPNRQVWNTPARPGGRETASQLDMMLTPA
jgi:hypothetical protein